jgi:hypothetical protein
MTDQKLFLRLCRGDGDLAGKLGSVGPEAPDLVPHSAVGHLVFFDVEPKPFLQSRSKALGNHDIDRHPADDVGPAISKHGLDGLIDVHGAALSIDAQDAVRSRVHSRAQPLLAAV